MRTSTWQWLGITHIRWANSTLNFTNNQTPATTSVDEWTSDLTGVGALIAIGSQEDIGNCALLVIATTHIMPPKPLIDPETILMQLEPTIWAKKIKRQISPTRLDINVRIAVLTRTKTSINRTLTII
jgi:hypothetical protein